MRKKIIPAMLLATLLAGSAQAEIVSDSLRTTVYYRTASSRLELPYMDNDRHLGALSDSIRGLGADPAVVLRRILIQASASPEGNTKANKELARKRGEDLRDYLKNNLSLFRFLVHIMAVFRLIYLVFAAVISDTDAEVYVQALGDRQRIAVFQPETVTEVAQIPFAARLEVEGQTLGVYAEVVSL